MQLKNESRFIEDLKNKETQNNAFESLLNQYKEPLYWHIRKIVLNHDDADDVLQNTFIKIFKGIKNFKGESKLYTWMYRIATNESLNFLKLKDLKFKHLRYSDHYNFNKSSIDKISELSLNKKILTTEKDFGRLNPKINNRDIFYIEVGLKFPNEINEDDFDSYLEGYLKRD